MDELVQDLAGRVWRVRRVTTDGRKWIEMSVETWPDGEFEQSIRYNLQRRRTRLFNFLRRAR